MVPHKSQVDFGGLFSDLGDKGQISGTMALSGTTGMDRRVQSLSKLMRKLEPTPYEVLR